MTNGLSSPRGLDLQVTWGLNGARIRSRPCSFLGPNIEPQIQSLDYWIETIVAVPAVPVSVL